MGTIKLTLTHEVTKNGQEFSGGTNYWTGIDNQALSQLVSLAVEGENAVKKQAGKGGPLTVTLTAAIEGADVPPEVEKPKTHTGLTLHGLNKSQAEISRLSDRLLKMGKDHADKKEGKKDD